MLDGGINGFRRHVVTLEALAFDSFVDPRQIGVLIGSREVCKDSGRKRVVFLLYAGVEKSFLVEKLFGGQRN